MATTKKLKRIGRFVKRNYVGWLFISPLIIGIAVFTLYPILTSIYYSFMDYDGFMEPVFVGFDNYVSIFKGEEAFFWDSIFNTLAYTFISIPISMTLSYLLALLLTKNSVTNQIFRILYYIPVLIPSIVIGFIWKNILDTNYGIINSVLMRLNLSPIDFFCRDNLMPTFIGIRLMSIGGGMIIWIAAFKGIPQTLYEAASLDGANRLRRFFAITLPLSTPSIFYNLVTGIIGGFQVFATAYVLTDRLGGDGHALFFVVMKIYNTAFVDLRFGAAMAMNWILFVIIAILTVISFKCNKWVYYGEDA